MTVILNVSTHIVGTLTEIPDPGKLNKKDLAWLLEMRSVQITQIGTQ
jgi:hypothetical protein